MGLEGASLISESKNDIMHQLIIPVSPSNLGLYRKIKNRKLRNHPDTVTGLRSEATN